MPTPLFSVFSFRFLQGDPKTALYAPHSLVLTQATAQKYFGEENPLGKILMVENKFDFTVTGVVESVHPQSHFRFDFLATIVSLNEIMGSWVFNSHKSWHWPPMYTYILLPPNYTVAKLESQFPEFIRKHIGEWAVSQRALRLQRLTDIHLHSDLESELEPTSKMAYIYIFSAAALLILLIACFNFMNLATARSTNRAKEVGLRKVVGAEQAQLIRQFLSESLFYAVLALLVAITLIELFLPTFNALVGKQLAMNYANNWNISLGILTLTLFVGIIAGSYPALFLSRFRPIHALQAKGFPSTDGRGPRRVREGLVTFQFIISIGLIIVTLVVDQQLRFVQSERLGFKKDHLIVIPLREEEIQQNYDTIKHGLLSQAGVLHATALSNFPWQEGYYDFPVRAEGMSENTRWNMPTLIGDHDFIRTFGMEIIAGREFSKMHTTDAQAAFILNETAVKKLGWESALDKNFEMDDVAAGGAKKGRVIGVVKDFHLRSLHHEIEPLALQVAPQTYYLDNIVVRVAPTDILKTLAGLEQTWRAFVPHRPFEYFFLNEAFDKLYRREQKLSGIFKYFSMLTIFVGCLGLFGLASFMVERRTKEIGIRKVLGASIASIALLLSRDFTRLVAIAFVIAAPVAYYFMKEWLQTFAYRIDIGWWVFALAAVLAFGIAWFTVSYQSIKAAVANPIDSLRYE